MVLAHMPGLRQNKSDYIESFLDGTLNYYACEVERLDVVVSGDEVTLTVKSRVEAAVNGGGRNK